MNKALIIVTVGALTLLFFVSFLVLMLVDSNRCLNQSNCVVENHLIIFNNTHTNCSTNNTKNFDCVWSSDSLCPHSINCKYGDIYFFMTVLCGLVLLFLSWWLTLIELER